MNTKNVFISLILFTVVLLSVSAAFASDDVATDLSIDEESTIDESLSVDDSPVVSDGNDSAAIVTKDNFHDYFTELGALSENVTSDELIFSGEISDVGVNSILIDRSIKLTGQNATFKDVSIQVISKDVIISGLTINQNNGTHAILLSDASNAQVENNVINFKAIEDQNGYAIEAVNADNLNLINNVINYVGTTNGSGINNALRIQNTTNTTVKGNKFNMSLVSADVIWEEIPPGSWHYVSFPVSEGIVVSDSNNVEFENNTVDSTYNKVIGSYDTIYAIDFKNTNNSVIRENDINVLGAQFVYGIIISGDNFSITKNLFDVVSDVYYANGIDVEGYAKGVIETNIISTTSITTAYPIYTSMSGNDVSVDIINNLIGGESYFVLGVSLDGIAAVVENNLIVVNGNYTIGVASKIKDLTLNNNSIIVLASNVGNESIWEAFGTDTIGVKIVNSDAVITNNLISSNSTYSVNVGDTNSTVHDNRLLALELYGDKSVDYKGNATVYNNTPVTEGKIVITAIDGLELTGIVTDIDNNPIENATVYYIFGNKTSNVTTDKNGEFTFTGVYNEKIYMTALSPLFHNDVTAEFLIKGERLETNIFSDLYTTFAIDFNAGERGNYFNFTLKDVDGNPLANKTVFIGFNGVTYNKTTDENGSAQLQINLAKAGDYTFAMGFLGDEVYNGAFAVQKITVNKKSTSISASAKSYKASATKKYTVKLSTDACSSITGKAIMKSGKTVKLTINGKTYKAKTNSAGKATFTIKLTKKGTYKAKIKFAGDNTYKASSKSVKIKIK